MNKNLFIIYISYLLVISFCLKVKAKPSWVDLSCLKENCINALQIAVDEKLESLNSSEDVLEFRLEIIDRKSLGARNNIKVSLLDENDEIQAISYINLSSNSRRRIKFEIIKSKVSLNTFYNILVDYRDGDIDEFELSLNRNQEQNIINQEIERNSNFENLSIEDILFNKVSFEPTRFGNGMQTFIFKENDTFKVKIPIFVNKKNVTRTRVRVNREAKSNINNPTLNTIENIQLGSSNNFAQISQEDNTLIIKSSNPVYEPIFINNKQQIGIGVREPQASLDIAKQSPNQAHIVLRDAPLSEKPINGGLEYHNGRLYFTANGQRKIIVANSTGDAGTVVINQTITGSSSSSPTEVANLNIVDLQTSTVIDFTEERNFFTKDISANTTFTFTNLKAGHKVSLVLKSNASALYNLSFPSYVSTNDNLNQINSEYKIIDLEVINEDSGQEIVIASSKSLGNKIYNFNDASIIFSLRKIIDSYGGNAIDIRRASDNSTLEIGFDGSGNLDSASINTFCAATDCFVVTWYNQVDTSNNATQTNVNFQPKIYDSVTGLITNNSGFPAILGDNSNDEMIFDLSSISEKSYGVFVVTERLSTGSNMYFVSANNDDFHHFGFRDDTTVRLSHFGFGNELDATTTGYTSPTTELYTFLSSSSAGKMIRRNTITLGSSINTNGQKAFAGSLFRFRNWNYNGSISEVIVIPKDIIGDYGNMESNIQTFYGL